METTLQAIIDTISQVLSENGQQVGTLAPSSRVLQDTGLDSLGLAEVVVRLEDKLQKDPFKNGFVNFRTIEELAKLYEQ